ncbi:MAG: signal peptidase I [Candidatus Marinarcus sp.]|uniref:signal peptidase I n=1 Tax=Candidatus Marinarcus sp. TaxID=3100987 RepID=UPI003AFFD984
MIKKIYNWSSSWTGTIVIVLTIIFFVAQAFVIPSGSMKNTLLIGDMLFVKKFSYGIPTPRIPWLEFKVLPDFNDNGHLIEGSKPQRGDIVVFRYPHDEKVHYVKRCVATGGDLVAVHNKHLLLHPKEGNEFVLKNYDKGNIVSIQGLMWVIDPYRKAHPGIHNDPSVVQNGLTPYQLFEFSPTQVPEGEFFMMGDNRDHSNDSRFWGTVQYKYIVGKPWFVYFSWDDKKEIRWDRMFKTVNTIEKEMENKEMVINHEKGIY